MQTAVRTTVACTVASALGQAIHMDQTFWAVITILVLAPPTVAASLHKAATRIAGTAVGCMAGAGATALFAQSPPLFLAVIFAALVVCLYMASGTFLAYSWFVAGFTMSIVCYSAAQHPENAGVVAWHRFTEIAMGVGVSGLSHLLLWPVHANRALEQSIGGKVAQTALGLDATRLAALGTPGETPSADPAPEHRLINLMDLLDTAEGLHADVRRHQEAWAALIGLSESTRLACFEASRLAALPAIARSIPLFGAPLAAFAGSLATSARELGECISQHGAIPALSSDAAAALDDAVANARSAGTLVSWKGEELSSLMAVIEALQTVASLLARLRAAVEATRGIRSEVEHLDLPGPEHPPLFPLDPVRARAAIKGAIASVLAILAGVTLHWSLGTPAVATCMVLAATGSMGAFVQKSALRFVGATIGGAAAIAVVVWVIPNIDSFTPFIGLVSLVFLVCNYILAGSERVSYIGMQASFAFAIGVLAPLKPTIELLPPVSRVLGVLAGIIIFGAVFLTLWPIYATREVRRGVGRLLEILASVIDDARSSAPATPFVSFPRQRRLYGSLSTLTRLLGESEFEDSQERDLSRAAMMKLIDTLRLAIRAAILLRQGRLLVQRAMPDCDTVRALDSLAAECSDTLRAAALRFAKGRAIDPHPRIALLVGELDVAIARERAAGLFRAMPIDTMNALFSSAEHLRAIAMLLERLPAHSQQVAINAAPMEVPTAPAAASAAAAAAAR